LKQQNRRETTAGGRADPRSLSDIADAWLFRLHIRPLVQKKLATDLLQNGFEPVPIYAAEEKPLIREWQCPHGPVTLERVLAQIENHPDHTNMGLLTRNMSTQCACAKFSLSSDSNAYPLIFSTWKRASAGRGPTPPSGRRDPHRIPRSYDVSPSRISRL
jgi:hypothetical protein